MFYLLFLISGKFAILFCGSTTWENYRQHANIFGVYDKLIQRGFKPSEIILFAYDDCSYHPLNPYPGQIFCTQEHINVYPGKNLINFTGNSVTAENFYKTLKNLPTTTDDDLFIYFSGHGGPNFIAAPVGPFIYSFELAQIFNYMYIRGLYNRCFFIIESCYSGTIADAINAKNMIMITSANSEENSFSDVFDTTLGLAISDQLSASFMYCIDKYIDSNIADFHDSLKQLVQGSHSLLYCPNELRSIFISNFIGKPLKNIIKPSPELLTINFHNNYNYSLEKEIRINKTKKLNYLLNQLNLSFLNKTSKIQFNRLNNYFEILKKFEKLFGHINEEDSIKLNLIWELSNKYSKKEIIKNIIYLMSLK